MTATTYHQSLGRAIEHRAAAKAASAASVLARADRFTDADLQRAAAATLAVFRSSNFCDRDMPGLRAAVFILNELIQNREAAADTRSLLLATL